MHDDAYATPVALASSFTISGVQACLSGASGTEWSSAYVPDDIHLISDGHQRLLLSSFSNTALLHENTFAFITEASELPANCVQNSLPTVRT